MLDRATCESEHSAGCVARDNVANVCFLAVDLGLVWLCDNWECSGAVVDLINSNSFVCALCGCHCRLERNFYSIINLLRFNMIRMAQTDNNNNNNGCSNRSACKEKEFCWLCAMCAAGSSSTRHSYECVMCARCIILTPPLVHLFPRLEFDDFDCALFIYISFRGCFFFLFRFVCVRLLRVCSMLMCDCVCECVSLDWTIVYLVSPNMIGSWSPSHVPSYRYIQTDLSRRRRSISLAFSTTSHRPILLPRIRCDGDDGKQCDRFCKCTA